MWWVVWINQPGRCLRTAHSEDNEMANFVILTDNATGNKFMVNLDCVASMTPPTTGTATTPSAGVSPTTLYMLANSGASEFVVKEMNTDIVGMMP